MPAHTPCVKCGVVGFVRLEHVISGGRAVTDYYCGHCQYSWTVDQNDKRLADTRLRAARTSKPDRSRS
jgi:hypothetical protein